MTKRELGTIGDKYKKFDVNPDYDDETEEEKMMSVAIEDHKNCKFIKPIEYYRNGPKYPALCVIDTFIYAMVEAGWAKPVIIRVAQNIMKENAQVSDPNIIPGNLKFECSVLKKGDMTEYLRAVAVEDVLFQRIALTYFRMNLHEHDEYNRFFDFTNLDYQREKMEKKIKQREETCNIDFNKIIEENEKENGKNDL